MTPLYLFSTLLPPLLREIHREKTHTQTTVRTVGSNLTMKFRDPFPGPWGFVPYGPRLSGAPASLLASAHSPYVAHRPLAPTIVNESCVAIYEIRMIRRNYLKKGLLDIFPWMVASNGEFSCTSSSLQRFVQ